MIATVFPFPRVRRQRVPVRTATPPKSPTIQDNLCVQGVWPGQFQAPEVAPAALYTHHMGSPKRTTQKDLAEARGMSRRNLQYTVEIERAGCGDLSAKIAEGRLSVRAAHREVRQRLRHVPCRPVIVDFSSEELEIVKARAARGGTTPVKWIRGTLCLTFPGFRAQFDAWFREPLDEVGQFPRRRSGESRRWRQYASAVERAGWDDLVQGMKVGYLSVWAAYRETQRRVRSGRESVVVLFSPHELDLIEMVRQGRVLGECIRDAAIDMVKLQDYDWAKKKRQSRRGRAIAE